MSDINPHVHERVALGAIILGGFIALIFAFPYVGGHITGPAALAPKTVLTPEEQTTQADLALRTKDTDQDELSDYDEMYIWNTSPYLSDTDSDGYTDKEEVESGNNPNCPKGKNCVVASSTAEGFQPGSADAVTGGGVDPFDLIPPSTQTELFGGQSITDQIFGNQIPGDEQVSQQEDMDALVQSLSEFSADDLRKLLLENGVPESVVNNLDDETITGLYQQSLTDASAEFEQQASE